jgi:hypothetical protein
MPSEPLFTDADVELAGKAVHDYACMGDGCSWSEEGLPCDLGEFAGFGRAALEALTAPGSPLVARIRAQAGEDAARAIEQYVGIDDRIAPAAARAYRTAARRARQVTTEEESHAEPT